MTIRARDTIGVKKQSAIGTQITANLVPIPVIGAISTSSNENVMYSGRINANRGENTSARGRHHWSGSIPMELDSTDCLFFIEQLLGDNTDTIDTPVAGANRHVIINTSTAADFTQMYTKGFTVGGSGADDTKGVTYGGCICTAVEIAETENGVYTFVPEFMARHRTEETITTTGSVATTDQLFNTLMATVSAGVDAAEVALPVTVTSLRIERTGINPAFRASSNLCTRWVMDDTAKLKVTGTMEIEMSDTQYAAVIDDWANNDTMSMIIAFTTDIFITGSTPYSLTFDMPESKYTNITERTDGHLRYIKFDFEAGQATGANLLTVTAINGTTTIPS